MSIGISTFGQKIDKHEQNVDFDWFEGNITGNISFLATIPGMSCNLSFKGFREICKRHAQLQLGHRN